MIGKKISKTVDDLDDYAVTAEWCNINGAVIEDRGGWYEVVGLPEPPEPTVEEVRAEKLAELNAAFEVASKEAHCRSSLGFDIDADEVANRNVTSLLVALEATGEKTVPFCAVDNSFHEVTTDELKTLQLEIIAHARTLYARKWALREAIAEAQTVKELEVINLFISGEND